MNVHSLRPDPPPHSRHNLDSFVVMLGILALFAFVAIVDIYCSSRFWRSAHDVAETLSPLGAVVFMLLGLTFGATLLRRR
jgi:hypothetical protein